jgi:ABC-type Co2+ transport system permease subunit
MTHIMVPDGVLPPWLWISGWVLAIAFMALALWITRKSDAMRLIPLAGTMAAVMAVVMSLEIVPLGYEPHLTVLAGILLGPAYGFLATFVFNVLRMLFGDGTVTLLGLNTLVLGVETIGGYYLFRALRRVWPAPGGVGLSAAIATVIALAIATLLFLGIIAISNVDLTAIAEEDFLARTGMDDPGFALYARLVLVLGAIGWVIEAVVVGAITAFIYATRPALVRAATAK